MGKYEVHYSCGHSATETYFGKLQARYDKIAYLENHGLCTECFVKKAMSEAQAKCDALEASVGELPPLVGTDKQIVWAHTLRVPALARMQALFTRELAAHEYLRRLVALFKAEKTSAKYWIDNRDYYIGITELNEFCEEMIKQNKIDRPEK